MRTILLIALAVTLAASHPVIETGSSSNSSIFLNETWYSGYQTIETKGDLFYWWFESRNEPTTDPLLVWLTGGPGCSSELGLFMENGPFKVNSSIELEINPYSWNNIANVIWLDQPLGTGFSTANEYANTESEIASDFYTFFTEFLNTYPQFEGRDLFIAGESYAGHYIPAITEYLLTQNNSKVNLKGIMIGDGWTDPTLQYPAYNTYSLANGLISQTLYNTLQTGFAACERLLTNQQFTLASATCNAAQSAILARQGSKFNVYNIKADCVGGSLCYDITPIEKFLALKEVTSALGAKIAWQACSNQVYSALGDDILKNQSYHVANILSQGLPVLAYSGDLDWICNWFGGFNWTNSVDWSGQAGFNAAQLNPVSTYGEAKGYDIFTFYRVYQAGHLVPMDQPVAALDMLNRFLTNQNLTQPGKVIPSDDVEIEELERTFLEI